jgi:hypothetical protein
LALVGLFRSRASLEAENMVLRHQLNVLQRKSSKRPMFGMLDRLIFAGLYRLAPKVLGALAIVKPETVIKWHRAGFRSYWRRKSRRRGGRPTVAPGNQDERYSVGSAADQYIAALTSPIFRNCSSARRCGIVRANVASWHL